MAMATGRNVVAMVDICRKMKLLWSEVPENTAGGSFRYWTENQQGGAKMVFGVNTSGKMANSPMGELDVWIRTDSLAEVINLNETEIRKRFLKDFQPFSTGHMDFIIRLKSPADADRLVLLLQSLTQ